MKKLAVPLVAALLALLAGCTPPLPEATEVAVDAGYSAPVTLPPGKSAFFAVTVGASPVRIDALAQDPLAADLDLIVYRQDRTDYALAEDPLYFHSDFRERAHPLALKPQILPTLPRSINLKANFGRAFVEVKNWSDHDVQVMVQAVSRGGPGGNDCSDLSSLDPLPSSFTGALIYLGQQYCWAYTGADNATLDFAYQGPLHPVLKVYKPVAGKTLFLYPGQQYTDLDHGDLVFVYDYTNRQIGGAAGFCNSLPGCHDGVTTGEFSLSVTP